MRFESLVLWEERTLLSEQENEEKGLLGFLRCYFTKDQKGFARDLSEWKTKDREIKEKSEALLRFLQTEDAFYILRSEVDMRNVCRDRMRDHVPYSFRRECWGFRVLTENRVWYLSCTPWNERKQFTVFGYDRKILMTLLASARGLPESCYGAYPFTGERIYIRFSDGKLESFPQYGGYLASNRAYADEKNATINVSPAQASAMENGVIYGWETPMANPNHYDENGHFFVPSEEAKERRR